MMSKRLWLLILLLGGLTAGVLIFVGSRPDGGGLSSPPGTDILPDAPDPAPEPTPSNMAAQPAGVRDEVRPLVARKLSSPDSSAPGQPGTEATAARPTLQIVAPTQPGTASTPPPKHKPEVRSYPEPLQQNAYTNFLRAIETLAGAKSEFDRYLALGNAAKLAFIFGKTEDARLYANELLALDEKFKGEPWRGGGAAFDGNLILGRIAAQEDRIEEAKQYLLESGKSTGSPVLGSFGPNMSLARDLLERGERDAVLEYLDLCAKFWKSDKLEQWSGEVKAGRSPDFGANLLY